VTHDLLDRDDPDLDRDWMDQQRRVRGFALAVGSRVRPLVGLAGCPREVAQKKEEERRAAEDMAGEIVERVVRETTVEKQG
jgi:hypothetical protein